MLSCTIVTTAACKILAPVHERMPVILTPDSESKWLDFEEKDPTTLLRLLSNNENSDLEIYPVSSIVNSPQNNVPQSISR